MADSTLRLTPLGMNTADDWSSVDWRLDGVACDGFVLSHSVASTHKELLVEPDRADHAIVAILLLAMQHRHDIVVDGVVSPKLLDNLETLQSIWHRWRPRRYHRVSIRAKRERALQRTTTNPGGLFAFSGGVDASYTMFRHLQGQAGRNSIQPSAALLVHGMDIPLDRPDFYAAATASVERMLKPTSVPLIQMRTNSRALQMAWEDSFGLQLSACFLALQSSFAFGVHGSGEPYDTLVLPWGSTPLTDSLNSTEAMQIIHDGCDLDRTEKIAWLADFTSITNDLRVCWAGEDLGKNCGECEKCLRTMLNFWATGHAVPSAFPKQLAVEHLSRIKIHGAPQLAELESLYKHALRHHNYDDPVLRAVKQMLFRAKLGTEMNRVRPLFRRILGR